LGEVHARHGDAHTLLLFVVVFERQSIDVMAGIGRPLAEASIAAGAIGCRVGKTPPKRPDWTGEEPGGGEPAVWSR
jgi:hypothetical protein